MQMLMSVQSLVFAELENVRISLDHMSVFVTKATEETHSEDVMVSVNPARLLYLCVFGSVHTMIDVHRKI